MSGDVTNPPLAESALRVDTREELVYLLGQACEIEHGVMCEYLYAQFSLKRGPDEEQEGRGDPGAEQPPKCFRVELRAGHRRGYRGRGAGRV